MENPTLPTFLTFREVCDASRFSEETVRLAIQEGRLKAGRPGRDYRIRLEHFLEWMATDPQTPEQVDKEVHQPLGMMRVSRGGPPQHPAFTTWLAILEERKAGMATVWQDDGWTAGFMVHAGPSGPESFRVTQNREGLGCWSEDFPLDTSKEDLLKLVQAPPSFGPPILRWENRGGGSTRWIYNDLHKMRVILIRELGENDGNCITITLPPHVREKATDTLHAYAKEHGVKFQEGRSKGKYSLRYISVEGAGTLIDIDFIETKTGTEVKVWRPGKGIRIDVSKATLAALEGATTPAFKETPHNPKPYVRLWGDWKDNTPEELVGELHRMFHYIPNHTEGALSHFPNIHVALRPGDFQVIRGRPVTAAGSHTVLSYACQMDGIPVGNVAADWSLEANGSWGRIEYRNEDGTVVASCDVVLIEKADETKEPQVCIATTQDAIVPKDSVVTGIKVTISAPKAGTVR